MRRNSAIATREWYKPIQEHYESGFPHDVDQFISTTATGLATLARARTQSRAGR